MQKVDILTLFNYNAWANRRILTTAEQLSDEEFNAPTAITVRNLRDTLIHALDVEWSWRLRLMGEPEAAWQQDIEPEEIQTVTPLAERWDAEARAMRAYLETLTDEDLNEPARPEPETRYPRWYYLMHILQHSAQSRADAATLLTDSGHSPGHLDFLDFADSIRAE